MTSQISKRSHDILCELGLIQHGQDIMTTPLTGGVASDIAHIRTDNAEYCVKFALPKLKVEADWFAPTHRNLAEYAWLRCAAAQNPEMAVTLYGQSHKYHGFVMEFLSGEDVYLWKKALLNGTDKGEEAGLVGDALGRIHAASSRPDFDRQDFINHDDFQALRIEPYLLYTAQNHPDLAETLRELSADLYQADTVLIHGDVSPKNIFLRRQGAVILDAECATMGDACFDIAFCLNHLVLKSCHLPAYQERYLGYLQQFWDSYIPHICWEEPQGLQRRTLKLLPALMLARIDGKSPVEYLDNDTRNHVRQLARQLLHHPALDFNSFISMLKPY